MRGLRLGVRRLAEQIDVAVVHRRRETPQILTGIPLTRDPNPDRREDLQKHVLRPDRVAETLMRFQSADALDHRLTRWRGILNTDRFDPGRRQSNRRGGNADASQCVRFRMRSCNDDRYLTQQPAIEHR
ncbi:MAG: hypothetical protein U0744_09655 [Gemmataceae bacterium]